MHSPADCVEDFPAEREAYTLLLSQQPVLSLSDVESITRPAGLPLHDVDDEVFGFRLLHDLGRGAFARVFLAKQGELAHREVVLKVSAIEGAEPQLLAQLQHTHVVPVYSVHEDPEAGIRAVCMPYLGGASLAKVLRQLWHDQTPISGEQFLAALDQMAGPRPAALSHLRSGGAGARDARSSLARMSYVQVAAWTVCRLAEGLQHAHDRGVLHRDIKPSNVLISAEAQPLLLDFNVAQAAGLDLQATKVGGTVSYMSPEHLRASALRTVDSAALVDERSDVYSLGLVLFEMLAGCRPFDRREMHLTETLQVEAMSVERSRSAPALKGHTVLDVPWSIESIVRKCLCPDPEQRYASAAELAEDLSRFLDDLPLRFAPELSRVEIVHKWKRRHPRLTTALMVAAVAIGILVPVGGILHQTLQHLETTRHSLTEVRSAETLAAFKVESKRALCLLHTVTPLDDNLRDGVHAAERALGMYGVLGRPGWQTSPKWLELESADRQALTENIQELLLLTAAARVQMAPENRATVQQSLALLDKAERIQGAAPFRALLLDRARYLRALQRDAEADDAERTAESLLPRNTRDYYLLATSFARQHTVGGYRDAIAALRKALEISPDDYWSHFQRALCYQELGEPLLAVADLSTCIGIWPASPWAYFNRGFVLDQQGKRREAVEDYTHCLDRDQHFVSAWFNRGLARLELKEHATALSDFDSAQRLGRTGNVVTAGRVLALDGLGQHAEADRLFDGLTADSQGQADPKLLQIRWSYAFAVAHRVPERARRIFQEILNGDPRNAPALHGQGLLCLNEARLAEALQFFDAALSIAPAFVEPRRCRALCLARQGDLAPAAEDMNLCLEREPNNSRVLYTASCVAALSARKLRAPPLRDQALKLLARALECGADGQMALDDADLAELRTDPRFRQTIGATPGR